VALVGTGPGDPELLTLKAVRAIEAADLVLYDRLVSNDVLDLVGEGARLLYVGKTAGYHSRTQVGTLFLRFDFGSIEVYTRLEMLIGQAFRNDDFNYFFLRTRQTTSMKKNRASHMAAWNEKKITEN
jgi:hypothetical protein